MDKFLWLIKTQLATLQLWLLFGSTLCGKEKDSFTKVAYERTSRFTTYATEFSLITQLVFE